MPPEVVTSRVAGLDLGVLFFDQGGHGCPVRIGAAAAHRRTGQGQLTAAGHDCGDLPGTDVGYNAFEMCHLAFSSLDWF